MGVLEHLQELRDRLFHSFIAIFAGFAVCWVFSVPIYSFLAAPAVDAMGGEKLAFTALTDPFFLYMKVAFLAGIFLVSPYLFLQIWKFVSPGLYPKERRLVFPFVLFKQFFP